MSIFGDRTAQGSYEDARSLGQQRQLKMQVCGTCKKDIFPVGAAAGLGYYRENYCQCMRVQQPQDNR